MRDKTRTKIINVATVLLTVAAFFGSWTHGVEWASEHGPDGAWAMFLASLPEVMVLLAVLKLTQDRTDRIAWVTGVSAVAWTLWANGAAAEPGVSGMVIALWPAYAALMALALNHSSDPEPDPAPVVQTRVVTRPPVTRSTGQVTQETRPALTQRPAAADPAKRVTAKADDPAATGQLAAALTYLATQPTVPTRATIMKATGVSDSTAKRAVAQDKKRRAELA